MEHRRFEIEGLIEFFPRVFKDDRGYFFETFQKEKLAQLGVYDEFVQDNQSFSTQGVLRGLHYQDEPFAQGKLVRVITGEVLDVAVDIRKNSATYGQYEAVILSAEKQNQFYIPPGFAHGFYTIKEAIFSYKCTNYYNKNTEKGIIWNDAELNIDWGVANPLVSDKDLILPKFSEITPF